MKIACTYNLRLTDAEEEAEFDPLSTIVTLSQALQAAGHDVVSLDVAGPASHLAARLESYAPDLILNLAEGRRGRTREAFYPALFEELGFPYTGSDAYTLTLTLDKWLTKLILTSQGVDSPRGHLVTHRDIPEISRGDWSCPVALPAMLKPNYEGSSKGIDTNAVVRDGKSLRTGLIRLLEKYPQGVLVEEFVSGMDITIPYLHGVGPQEMEGILQPVSLTIDPALRGQHPVLDFRLKQTDTPGIIKRCPADIPRDLQARLRTIGRTIVRRLGIKDVATLDFRLAEDGRIYFLEANAIPSLQPGGSLLLATQRESLSYEQTIQAILTSAAVRWKLVPASKPKTKTDRIRLGFTYNVKSPDSKAFGDAEAEYDSPETIESIRTALESLGHEVVPLEVNGELPAKLSEAKVDLVFNIAEGGLLSGRNREAQVPALCELCGIPYTGSDSATLALALDKALTKRILQQHGVRTPAFQVMNSGRERLNPALRFPLIVKPIAEGSSKGIVKNCVVDDEAGLRQLVRELIERYKQAALVEEYIQGREFTVGLLGDRRPRVLPPMEICFKDVAATRPVYDYEVKQEWEKHVFYRCPPEVTPTELRAIERAARDTFQALDCRDVGRVDIRMTPQGEVFVLEINPLPGLTPGYSDLVLIAEAAGMDYRTLIAEILSGGLKRLREKRRDTNGTLTNALSSPPLVASRSLVKI